MKKLILTTLLSLAFLQACASDGCIQNKKTFPSLDAVYQSDEFRVYYSVDPKSPDYLKNQVDLNENGIPDIVENVVIQASSTSESLRHLGFKHPLESDRYKNKAKFIDIHLISMNGNGSAGENAINYYNQKNKNNTCSLTIAIRNSIDFPGNYWTIVNHELFHLYQYSYTQFKGGWFLEGMTNSMERLFKKGPQGGLTKATTLLPSTQTELDEKVYSVAYNELWARLAFLSDQSNGQLKLPNELLNRTYIDGSKVFKDEQLKGYIFFRTVLENMGELANDLSKNKSWDKHHWKESNQISPLNRPHMLKVIQVTMIQFGMDKSDEEKRFLELN